VEDAEAMQGLSKVEWFIRGKTPGYRTQLKIFLEIIKQAKQNNLEGSTLAFSQLTISCVNCHKRLRASKRR
jgi:cytochrome c556